MDFCQGRADELVSGFVRFWLLFVINDLRIQTGQNRTKPDSKPDSVTGVRFVRFTYKGNRTRRVRGKSDEEKSNEVSGSKNGDGAKGNLRSRQGISICQAVF